MTDSVSGGLVPHNVHNMARIYTDPNGRQWVTHQELLECDYIHLSDFDIVYLNGKFYELQGHANVPNAWWIEEVPLGETETETPE